MGVEPISTKGEVFTSVLVAAVLYFLLSSSMVSGLTDSLMRDGSLLRGSKYTITQDALDTISEDNMVSVIHPSVLTYVEDGQWDGLNETQDD